TVSDSLTGAGPMATGLPPAPPFSSSAPTSGACARAVAAAATPEPRRKSRRDGPGPWRSLPWVSSIWVALPLRGGVPRRQEWRGDRSRGILSPREGIGEQNVGRDFSARNEQGAQLP